MSEPGATGPGGADRESVVLALLLAALAGWIDALGYLRVQGLFVSFMSGNSTRAAVAVPRHDLGTIAQAGRAIVAFVAGVVAGELVAPAAGRFGRALVLALEAALLWTSCLLWSAGGAPLATGLGLAMGLQNASVHKAGGISVALTYVTGTLVHLGRAVAAALRGAGTWRAVMPFLALWGALVAGGVGGALAAQAVQGAALWAAAAAATLLALWSLRAT